MIPASTAMAQTAAKAAPRLGFVYFAHGALQDEWQPKQIGRDFELPFISKPLEPYRDHLTIISGLRNKAGEGGTPHGYTEETWLSAVLPRNRNAASGRGITIDQIAAKRLGKNTTLPSLELCGEPGGSISYRTATQPLPLESNPRKVFYTMFGQGDNQRERTGILKSTSSLLDYVKESAASLNSMSSVQETVTVTSEAPLIEVTQSRLGGNVDPRQMQELPVNGRNWMDLATWRRARG